MRSLIILEVEHGETTDPVEELTNKILQAAPMFDCTVNDYTFKVDLPKCFVLEA